MARSELIADSSPDALTPDTPEVLHTWDAPSGGASYVGVVDARNLVDEEFLYFIVKRETVAGDGATIEYQRWALAAHSGSLGVETPMFGAPAGAEISVELLQIGGTGRVIPWSIERVDG